MEKLKELLEAANEAARQARAFFITFLALSFYLAIIIWSTTDEMLLRVSPVHLPLLGVDLPIKGFYAFTPFVYLLFHFNLLLQLYLLAEKLHALQQSTNEVDADQRHHLYRQLHPFAFGHYLLGDHHNRLARFILAAMVWITVVLLPLALLLGLQVGFLPFHDPEILLIQRLVVLADVALLLVFWPMLHRPGQGQWLTLRYFWGRFVSLAEIVRRSVRWILQKISDIWEKQRARLQQRESGKKREWQWKPKSWEKAWTRLEPFRQKVSRFMHALFNQAHLSVELPKYQDALVVVVTLSVLFSWGVAVLPDSAVEEWLKKHLPAALSVECKKNEQEPLSSRLPLHQDERKLPLLTEWLFDDCTGDGSLFHRNLVIREKVLVQGEIDPQLEAQLASDDPEVWQKAHEKIRGLNLRGRNLSYADFSGSLLPKVDLRSPPGEKGKAADLTKAILVETNMREGRLEKVDLQGAFLWKAQLQGADLGQAQLQGADLGKAQLQGADLGKAQLQGADLSFAQMEGADLILAQLQGADLGQAQLQGADLGKAQLQGADLGQAQLQGADLGKAQLQGANLRFAQLQGADLMFAQLQGADLGQAQLQGADLSFAQLQEANFQEAQLQGANLKRARLEGARLVGSRFDYADLRGAVFVTWVEEVLDKFLEVLGKFSKEQEGSIFHVTGERFINAMKEGLNTVRKSIDTASEPPVSCIHDCKRSQQQQGQVDASASAGCSQKCLFLPSKWRFDAEKLAIYYDTSARYLLDQACNGIEGGTEANTFVKEKSSIASKSKSMVENLYRWRVTGTERWFFRRDAPIMGWENEDQMKQEARIMEETFLRAARERKACLQKLKVDPELLQALEASPAAQP